MNRVTRYAILMLLMALGIAGTASATTYYVAANGSDSNNGTSKSTPWLHAPGMPNCAGTCASSRPQGGDSIILRGGDTWHFGNSSASPYVGSGTWSIYTFSGSGTSCQLNELAGPVVRSSCLYVGVDKTWFTGASFARPILTQDNPLSTSYVASCPYPAIGFNAIRLGNYTILDNFDLQGDCYGSTSANAAFVRTPGNYVEVSNSYFHGWTLQYNAIDDYQQIAPESGHVFTLIDYDVIDGSDSTDGTTPGYSTGDMMSSCDEIIFTVLRHGINGCVNGATDVHDDLIEYMYNSGSMGGGNHGNVTTMPQTQNVVYFYNNTMRHIGDGVGATEWPVDGGTAYIFNNVIYDDTNNCLWLPPAANGVITYYITNNTFGDATCSIGSNSVKSSNTVYMFENNHMIGWTSVTTNSPSWSLNVSGNQFQTISTASSQGYTAANNFQPTSTSGVTYHAGTNLSTSCPVYSFNSDLCNGTSAGSTTTVSGLVQALIAAVIPGPPARGATWDAGAYQFGSGSTGVPSPPTSVTATVQ